ncbi:MAG: hypothetical protein K0A93_13120, partial [Desulfuromonadaceae bacterium]|nr:hypothetical protein [Desulfuromonadaceae bacterium]
SAEENSTAVNGFRFEQCGSGASTPRQSRGMLASAHAKGTKLLHLEGLHRLIALQRHFGIQTT